MAKLAEGFTSTKGHPLSGGSGGTGPVVRREEARIVYGEIFCGLYERRRQGRKSRKGRWMHEAGSGKEPSLE